MKGKTFSKSKLVAIISCLCLALTSLVSASFLFNKKENVFASEGNVGYYVQDGASVRFDAGISGLRYETVVTKEQYDAWIDTYGAGATFEFHTVISFAPGEEKVDVTYAGDITAHDFNAGDFVYKAVKFFDLKQRTNVELFEIYNSQWKAESYVLINGQRIDADSANNLRSMRSVALLNRIKATTSNAGDLALLKEFTQNFNGSEFVELKDEDIFTDTDTYYYNNYADASNGISFDFAEALPAGDVNFYVGANAISETDAILSNERNSITVKNVKEFLTVGESEYFVLDANVLNKVFVKSNVIDATEVFFNENGVERMQEVFTINGAETFVNSKIERDAVLDDFGEKKTSEFYNVDRGYYVLGEDIDFAGALIAHDRDILESKRYYSGDTNKNAPEGFYRNTDVINMSGQFGFGGTFNGNGYTIKNYSAARVQGGQGSATGDWTKNRISGFFGALAYGARIENVAFTGISYGSRGEAYYGTHSVLATWAGKSADDAYLSAKYGEEPAIVIDNCYFDFDKTNYTVADIGTSSAINNARSAQGRGIIIQTGEGVSLFSNCVFQTYNSEPFGVRPTSDGGYGIIADSRTKIFDENFENCFMISAPKSNGRVEPVYQVLNPYVYDYKQKEYVALDGYSVGEKAAITKTDDKWDDEYDEEAHPFVYKPESSREIYAANDAQKFGITNGVGYTGTQIYTGVVDGKYVVAIPDSVNKYTANKTALAYSNLYRYDNYADMIVNNNKASLEGFNTDFWNVEGGAVIWNGGVNDGNDYSSVTLNVGYTGNVKVGTPVQLKVTMFGHDVTASATIANGNGYTVDNDAKTVTLTENAEVTVNVTLGNKYFGSIVLTSTEDYDQAIVTSSAYSAVKGAKSSAYSVPYKYENGNLVATDLVEIYRDAVDNSGATLSSAFLMDNGQAQLGIIKVEDKSYVALADPGRTPTLSRVALHGSHGVILLTNNTVVTLVVEDADGFKYIPKDEDTRKGSYYLAKDFDNRIDANSTETYGNLRLSTPAVSDNTMLGYSFGSATADWTGSGFHGLFDGLGHTINYLETQGVGLLGVHTGNTLQGGGAVLQNVKFDNMAIGKYVWDGTSYGQRDIDGDGEADTVPSCTSASRGGWALLAKIYYSDDETDVQEKYKIKVENVVIDFKTGTNNGTYSRFALFTYEKSSAGTYKSNKVALKNVVLKYPTDNYIGKMGNQVGAGHIFDSGDKAIGYDALNRVLNNQMRAQENVYIISKPTKEGRIASVTGFVNNAEAQYIGLAENDFDTLIPGGKEYTTSWGGTIKTTMQVNPAEFSASNKEFGTYGWGKNSAGKYEIVSTLEVAEFTYEVANNRSLTAGSSHTVFFAYNNVYRFDDYEALGGAVSRVGSWAVATDGTITWAPQA